MLFLVAVDIGNERLVLLYADINENIWHIDKDVRLTDSNLHDVITTNILTLHSRMIVARYDKHLMTGKQLQAAIGLLEQKLSQRSVTLLLRHRASDPREICLVCCSSGRADTVRGELEGEQYSSLGEQTKEIVLQEGQLLECRFRGNVLPVTKPPQGVSFAFNTNYPFYLEQSVTEVEKYSQHLSAVFYGYVQVYSKPKLARNSIKDSEKRKQPVEQVST